MKMTKSLLAMLLAILTVLTCLSAAFCAAAEDAAATAQSPLTVDIKMSKSSYFVSAKAKATVTVKNIGSETLKNVAVSAYSEKHQLPKGSEASFKTAELKAGEEKSYSFTMVLNRKKAGVTFFERVFLFFAQLFRKFEPMQTFPALDGVDMPRQEITFRHGSVSATLEVNALYETGTDPVRPQVTYLDQYVLNILKSSTFTLDAELNADGITLPFTVYEDKNDFALETTLTAMILQRASLPATLANLGKIRLVTKDKNAENPKYYLVMTGMYCELEESQDFNNILDKQSAILDVLTKELVYCDKTTVGGIVCETYKTTEGQLYNFYFAKTDGYEGVVRVDQINPETQQINLQIILRVYNKVTNSDAFTLSGKEVAYSEIEKLFNS